MSMVPITHYTLIGEVLTPIHIGDGTVITPLEYVVIGDEVIRFRPEVLLRYLPEAEQEQVVEYLEQADIVALRRWFGQQFENTKDHDLPPAVVVTRSKASKSIQQLYRDKLGDVENQMELQPFIYHPMDGQPYIPGSSLKGALRTAVISQEANRKLRRKAFWHDYEEGFRNDKGSAFSRKALGCTLQTDPFRAIKVSDAILLENSTQYASVYNLGLNKEGKLRSDSGSKGIPIQTEVLLPGVVFTTTLTFFTALQALNENRSKETQFLSLTVTEQDLIKACQHYYSYEVIQAEMERFFNAHSGAKQAMQPILDIAKNRLADNQFLLRLGGYSQFEYKAAHAFRVLQDGNHKTPTRDGRSRNLMESLYPLGWVRITLLKEGETYTIAGKTHGAVSRQPAYDVQALQAKLQVFQARENSKLQAIIARQEEEARRIAAQLAQEQRIQAAAEQQLAAAAQRRAQMSPLEQSIEELLKANPLQADYVTLLQALQKDHFDRDEDKKIVAQSIRQRMIEAKIWKETTKAKKPEKDKDYQRTQEVLKYLK